MSYYIRLDNDRTIELPTELNTKERIELCETIIADYPNYFQQCLAGSNCSEVASYKVELRLEIMANYLLNSIENKVEYPLISKYRSKQIKNNEKLFSEMEQRYDFN